MTERDGGAKGRDPGEYVGRVRDETRSYIRDLLDENEKLRHLGASLEAERCRLREEKISLQEQILALREQLDRHDQLRLDLERQMLIVEESNRQFSDRYADVEEQNNVLANLYVASYRLHSTPAREQVLEALKEIIVNLVGSEEFALFERGEGDGELRLVGSCGLDPASLARIGLGSAAAVRAIEHSEVSIGASAGGGADDPLVCIPMRLEDRVTGLIVIVRLLPHKRGLEPLDFELFELLASHAAMALYASGLHGRVETGVEASS